MTFIERHRDQLKEIARFLIVGVIATLADLATYSLFYYLIYTAAQQFNFLGLILDWRIVIATIAGFTIGVIVNYICSIFFVFKNVENKKKSRSVAGFILFVVLGLIGLLLNIGIKQAGNALIPLSSNVFWNLFVFGVATLIVLVYNYISRKLLLFKARKVDDNPSESEDVNNE